MKHTLKDLCEYKKCIYKKAKLIIDVIEESRENMTKKIHDLEKTIIEFFSGKSISKLYYERFRSTKYESHKMQTKENDVIKIEARDYLNVMWLEISLERMQ